MPSFTKLILLLCSIATVGYTIYVVGKFTMFLSMPRSISKAHTWIFNLLDNKSRLETAYGPIVFDTLFVIGFILQHSLLKSAMIKNLLNKFGLTAAERTIYALTSSLCLHVRIALIFVYINVLHSILLVSDEKLAARSIDCSLANQRG